MMHILSVRLSDVANVISVISGLMTILGIGGLISWGFLKKDRDTLAANLVSIFAFSVKTGLCLLLLWPLVPVVFMLHSMIVLTLGPDQMASGSFLWNSDFPIAYCASYLINAILWVPLYLLLCACIYSWSFRPFRLFSRLFRR
jgi:hypothetical protein